MTLPELPEPWAVDDTPTADELNAVVEWVRNPPRGPICRVLRTTAQTGIASSTNNATLITWQDADEDPEGWWSVASPTVITVGVAGLFRVWIRTYWTANTTGAREAWVTANNTFPSGVIHYAAGTGLGGNLAAGMAYVRLAEGDVLRGYARQNSGSTLSLLPDVHNGIQMGVEWVMP